MTISTRAKLTAAYVAGLAITACVVAVISVTIIPSAARVTATARAADERADFAVRVLRTYKQQQVSDTLGRTVLDSLIMPDTGDTRRRFLSEPVRELLRTVDGYVIVRYKPVAVPPFRITLGWRQIFSRNVAVLADTDVTVLVGKQSNEGPDALALIDDPAISLEHAQQVQLPKHNVVLVARDVSDLAPELDRVFVAVPIPQSDEWPPDLAFTLLIVVPGVIAVSGWIAWLLLAGTFERLARIRREVADITDGRSLHRRLSFGDAPPELEELIETLNAMIARLETSFVALRRFTADASHELKTPLTVLRADVERAMHQAANKTERMIALEEALHETTRMADLVESLLTLARADEGRFEIVREPVDMKELVQEVYETALILGEAAGVTVTLPFTAEVTVLGDRARIRQLLLNLVTNAIKYTSAGGRVDLGLGRHPGYMTFAVRDTGIGIAAADLPHIFERFWRADRARTRMSERGGFGLGLAISQWIAQAHGGSLTVSSRLGKGSLFTVTLPLPEEAPSDEPETRGEFINS